MHMTLNASMRGSLDTKINVSMRGSLDTKCNPYYKGMGSLVSMM